MQLTIKFMGALKESRETGETSLESADSATVEQVLEQLGIGAEQVQIVMRNGKPAPDRSIACEDGDELTLVPPVGGG